MIHLIKVAVGVEDVAQLEHLQEQRRWRAGRLFHRTRRMPRRAVEVIDGGSIYWVIRGEVRARQRVIGIEPTADEDGRPATLLLLDRAVVRTRPVPWRVFQGWRYLVPADAPADAKAEAAGGELAGAPAEMLAELRALGLL